MKERKKSDQLRLAIKSRHFNEVKELLRGGTLADTIFSDRTHSLEDYFSYRSAHKMVRLLSEKGRLSINRKDKYGHTILEVAIYKGDKNLLHYLLKERKTDVNIVTSFGMSPLCLAIKLFKQGTCDKSQGTCDKSFVIDLLQAGANWRQDKCFVIDEVEAMEYRENFSKLASFLVKRAVFFK